MEEETANRKIKTQMMWKPHMRSNIKLLEKKVVKKNTRHNRFIVDEIKQSIKRDFNRPLGVCLI
jgi:hypothetical protein